MATDHLLPFHLYFRHRENVIALHILASISKERIFFFFCKRTATRLFVPHVLYLRLYSFASREYYIRYHFVSRATDSILLYISRQLWLCNYRILIDLLMPKCVEKLHAVFFIMIQQLLLIKLIREVDLIK